MLALVVRKRVAQRLTETSTTRSLIRLSATGVFLYRETFEHTEPIGGMITMTQEAAAKITETGAQALVESLERLGVEVVFGIRVARSSRPTIPWAKAS